MRGMFFKKYGDIVVGVFFMVLGALLIILAQALPKSKVMEIGPDFMPTVIGSVTFILAAILTFLSIKNFKMHGKELEHAEIPDCDYKRVISSIILVLIYVFILQPIGFIISTLLYLMFQMVVLSPDDERDGKHIIRLAVLHLLCGFTMSRGLICLCFSQDIEDTIRLLLESGTTMQSVRHSLARTIGNMLIEIFPMRL